MGTYTDNQNFYLSDPTELVDVEQDLNYNFRRADQRIRPLVEYQVTDVPSVAQSSLPKDIGFKWWKTYTGAIWNYHTNPTSGITGTWQDPNAQVDTWTDSGIAFESGYGSANQEDSRITYSSFSDFVRWRGRLVLTSGGELPANVTTDFLTPPNGVLPIRARYFFVHGGNAAAGDFQTFRIFIPAAGSGNPMEFIKYGGTSTNSGERYISLNDIHYSLDDTP